LSLIITKKYYSNSDKENGTSVWLQPLLDAWLGNRFAWWPRWPLSRRLGRLPCLAAASMKRSFMDAMIEWFDEDDAERKIITQLRSHLAQDLASSSPRPGSGVKLAAAILAFMADREQQRCWRLWPMRSCPEWLTCWLLPSSVTSSNRSTSLNTSTAGSLPLQCFDDDDDEWRSNADGLSSDSSIAHSPGSESLSTCASNSGRTEWGSEPLQHSVGDDLSSVWRSVSSLLFETLSVVIVVWAEFHPLFDAVGSSVSPASTL